MFPRPDLHLLPGWILPSPTNIFPRSLASPFSFSFTPLTHTHNQTHTFPPHTHMQNKIRNTAWLSRYLGNGDLQSIQPSPPFPLSQAMLRGKQSFWNRSRQPWSWYKEALKEKKNPDHLCFPVPALWPLGLTGLPDSQRPTPSKLFFCLYVRPLQTTERFPGSLLHFDAYH